MTSAILSALVQVLAVLAIAFLAWLAARRANPSFFRFVGLTRAPPMVVAAGAVTGLAVALAALLIPGVAEFAGRAGTSAHQAGQSGGLAALLVIAAFRALIQTSLSEEILFRGLIGRNLIRKIGFARGNAIQAALFGAVHGLIGFIPGVAPAAVLAAVVFSGSFGWINGWLNERFGHGSILPGWAAHGTANLVTNIAVATMLVAG